MIIRSNCTLVELKQPITKWKALSNLSSNCTLVELKPTISPHQLPYSECSNCTLVELKRFWLCWNFQCQ